MAFSMDGIIIDRIQYGIAEDFSGNILYTLTQLADATINITAESKDAVDKDGTLIKRFYTGKSGTFEANNAIVDFNILAAGTGTSKAVATNANSIVMPGIMTVAAGTTSVTLNNLVADSVQVVGIASNGTKVTDYTLATAASATEFAVSNTTLTLPTDTVPANFVVKYNRTVTSGVKVVNKADEFPGTIKLTLKALAIDTCSPDVVRSVYIVLPSFQVSPETSLSLTTDAQLSYNGDLQVSYCGSDGKVLYEIYFAEDDVEA